MSTDGRERFALVFELCPVGLALTAEGGRIVEANPALAELLGYQPAALVGARLLDLTHPDDKRASDHAGGRVLSGERREAALTKRYLRADGEPVDVRVTMIVLDDPHGEARKLTQVEDLTAHRAREADLQRQLEHDELTGLTNRRGLDRRLEPLLAGEADAGSPPTARSEQLSESDGARWAVLYVDLDDFKAVNDRYGHRTGDRVLEIVGGILDGGTRDGDLVARVGGDEFVVVLSIVDEAEIRRAAARLHEALDRPIQVDDHTLEIRASIGAAVPRRDDSPADVLERADREMYRRKPDEPAGERVSEA